MTTHIEAILKDFRLIKDADKQVTHWEFRWDLPECEDFYTSMEEFKNKIPHQDRKPFPEKSWLWQVVANDINYVFMAQIFDNFVECETIARSQLDMFE